MIMGKLGRNALCACGSGKKYKNCCLSKSVFSLAEVMAEALKYHEAGDFSKAQALYLQILQHQAEEPDALHLLGVLFFQLGDFSKACSLIEKAVSIRPENPDYLNHLGMVYRSLRRWDEVLECFQKAEALAPEDAVILSNLGTAFNDVGLPEKAIFYYTKALEHDVGFVDAWNNLGSSWLGLEKMSEALFCFEQVIKLDASNETARHWVSALTGRQTERAPNVYIESTFDSYAEKFDGHLLESLQYNAPKKLAELIVSHSAASFENVLDLGCGTGLAGLEIAAMSQRMVGVDLSSNMLDKARQRNIYHGLYQSDLLSHMRQEKAQSYDLIISADVFVYFGKLDEVMHEIARLLRPGGLVAFTAETLELEGFEYRLNSTGRYAHSERYLKKLALDHRFKVYEMQKSAARVEKAQPVYSWLNLWGHEPSLRD